MRIDLPDGVTLQLTFHFVADTGRRVTVTARCRRAFHPDGLAAALGRHKRRAERLCGRPLRPMSAAEVAAMVDDTRAPS